MALSMVAARRAYAAYGASTGGLTHDGRRRPAWDDLGEPIQQAWLAAANAAAASHTSCPHTDDAVVVHLRLDPAELGRMVRDAVRSRGLGTVG